MQGAKAIGMASPRLGERCKALGKRALAAGRIDAPEAADAHHQDQRAPETREITEAAPVVAVNPGRPDAAGRAGSACMIRLYPERNAAASRIDPIDDMKVLEGSERLEGDQQNEHSR